MTKTEKLSRELYDVICRGWSESGAAYSMVLWEELGSCELGSMRALARHVLRREQRVRKAKR